MKRKNNRVIELIDFKVKLFKAKMKYLVQAMEFRRKMLGKNDDKHKF